MSTSANTPRTKLGCQHCRLRHVKCDERRPACARCEKAGIECIRGINIRFRHDANPSVANKGLSGNSKTDNDFNSSQTWVKTTRNLTFLDETRELISIYDHNREHDSQAPSELPPVTGVTDQTGPTPQAQVVTSQPAVARVDSIEDEVVEDVRSPLKRRRLTFMEAVEGNLRSPGSRRAILDSPPISWLASPHTGWTPSATINESTQAVSGNGLTPSALTTVSNTKSQLYLDTPVWPLEDLEEAKLMRYYIENLARNFDLTDPVNHFRSIVPQRAASCPTLLNAIFALSARHWSRVGDYDPLVSNRYHQACLKDLIPLLDDNAAILDENLLASTIILRHLEEIEVPLSGQSPTELQFHLFGAHIFMTAQERATIGGGLRQAAFWTGLRQEIYVAFVNQRPIIPALEYCNIDRSLEPAADHLWSCRMVVLVADTIRHCFGESASTTTYHHLVNAVDEWYSRKPASFTPIYFRESDESAVFPVLWFGADDIVVGLQHYHLARILLVAHNPRLPKLGPGRAAGLKAMDEEIKDHVRALCGICVSNPDTPPNFTYASMGITLAGERFTNDRKEQEAMIAILDACDTQHAWPTGSVQEALRQAWGW